jgi:ATP cone domain
MVTRPPRATEWPATVRRRDGRLVPFDLARIEGAVARAAREAGHRNPDAPGAVARSVADALARRPPGGAATVEEIQDLVEAELVAAGLDDVARAYIFYRQQHAELRAAKGLIGMRDELKLSIAAVTVLAERYLLRDDCGRPTESTGEMMDRVAGAAPATRSVTCGQRGIGSPAPAVRPAARCRFLGSSMPRPASSRWAGVDAAHPWLSWTSRTPTFTTSSPPRPTR